MKSEQMSLFSDGKLEDNTTKECLSKEAPLISTRMLEGFVVADIPFLECDFDITYPKIAHIMPSEIICFDLWGLETTIACETVCAAICHQMNWDYLRYAVFEKTKNDREWVSPQYLSQISEETVKLLFTKYNKPNRIRARERTDILRQVGKLATKLGSFCNLFFDKDRVLLSENQIRNNYFMCPPFSQDPGEKKLQLLFQKLSNYTLLAQLAPFCKPTVDYHLIRCFLRRGLISPKSLFKNF